VENKKLIFDEEAGEKLENNNSLSKDSDEGEVYEECLEIKPVWVKSYFR
jgi:hypothetical protein